MSKKKELNENKKIISDFGFEWKKFNHQNINKKVLYKMFIDYFHIFPFKKINKTSVGFDMGAGSGRWAMFISPKVKILNIIGPSLVALKEAKKNLYSSLNCKFYNKTVLNNKLKNNSQDFGYCLGVLHHTPDVLKGLKICSNKLKKGAPFLLYLYYNLDNKSKIYKLIWKTSDVFRKLISILPFPIKYLVSQLLAFLIYYPLAKISLLLEYLKISTKNMPLSYYRNKSFYMMRTDSLDRFGTRVEKRFSKVEINKMMKLAGFRNIKFSPKAPFWVVLGYKA